MTTRYIVYNPLLGENIYVDSQEQARELFLQLVTEFITPYFHNCPYTIAETDDNGIETISSSNIVISDILIGR